MDCDLSTDNIFIQVRDKLQKDNVKLWQEPYFTLATGASVENLQRLAKDHSNILNIPYNDCYSAIFQLQSHALEKLKQRAIYRESGIATLKIKILGQNLSPKIINKEILLSVLGSELKQVVSECAAIQHERIKLIANGKVLSDTESLQRQGVQHGNQILALLLKESLNNLKESESQIQEIENVKADTSLLVSDDSYYMELEDQAGNPVKIPKKERKALMVALALHEKGRTALKNGDCARALVFFLDADKEFSHCNSQVLSLVDNYALLDLDIAWCYMCLQSVNHLPEAFNRLKRCELSFEKIYGPNLERLIAVKGTPGNEAALFLRLHLLQAIVLFHQNKREESLQLFYKVEKELQQLKVDDNSILALVELGYSTAEARLGLRATHGDINIAANYINENREKRSESRKKALTEKILQREQKKLGQCADGVQFVNPTFIKMLENMGYNKEVARLALQKCNNIISDSIQYIQENPGPSNSKSQELLSLINDFIPELEEAGFDHEMAKKALQKYNGDIIKAADELLKNNGVVNFDVEDSEENIDTTNKKAKMSQMKEEAFQRLSQDISMVDDDHLDLNLQQEEEYLRQYMSLFKED